MSNLKKEVIEQLGVTEKEFESFSTDALMEQIKKTLEKRSKENPNEMKLTLFPSKKLKEVCEPITDFNETMKTFARQLLIFCRRHKGLGISAPQVGVNKNLMVIDIDSIFNLQPDFDTSTYPSKKEMNNFPDTFFNPSYEPLNDEKVRFKEGCLSIPKVFGYVNRFANILVKYQNEDGKACEIVLKKISENNPYGIVIQHEIDHLNGIQFIDRMTQADKAPIWKTLNKLRK